MSWEKAVGGEPIRGDGGGGIIDMALGLCMCEAETKKRDIRGGYKEDDILSLFLGKGFY